MILPRDAELKQGLKLLFKKGYNLTYGKHGQTNSQRYKRPFIYKNVYNRPGKYEERQGKA